MVQDIFSLEMSMTEEGGKGEEWGDPEGKSLGFRFTGSTFVIPQW